jgi:peroxiredoxin
VLRLAAFVILGLMGTPVATAEDAAFGDIEIGAPAPDFTLTDLDGGAVKLADLRGKTVVLEWFNPGCPFVVSAHERGPLTDAAARWTEQGVVWLAINSGAPGKQGTGAEKNRDAAARWTMGHPILLDESGAVGRAYRAKTTPQIAVIDAAGNQVYNGALDNAPMGRVKGETHTVYVDRVLEAVTQGQPSPHKRSKPYGCSVKYGS